MQVPRYVVHCFFYFNNNIKIKIAALCMRGKKASNNNTTRYTSK